MPYVDTTRSNCHYTRHRSPILGEVDTARLVLLNVVVTEEVNEAHCDATFAFQFTHNCTGVNVVTTRHPQGFSQYTEVNTVVLLTVNNGVHSTVNVQQNTVLTTPMRQGGVSCETCGQVVVHDDGHFEFFSVLSPFQHLFTGRRGYVQVVTLDFAGFCLCFVDCFCYEQEAIAPSLEWCRVDVFIIF